MQAVAANEGLRWRDAGREQLESFPLAECPEAHLMQGNTDLEQQARLQAIYGREPTDSRRQTDNPSAPIASRPNVAGLGGIAMRAAGPGCWTLLRSSGPLVLPAMIGLFGDRLVGVPSQRSRKFGWVPVDIEAGPAIVKLSFDGEFQPKIPVLRALPRTTVVCLT